ncbi:DMT family transporter [Patescibacteria group bacterium]|nr:DMT family transporter [Patescibacteria group bacterium]MCG2702152.1 DMT family transporter [Candidatus Parcubacteria bacterium]MBU4264801.1 DMT family transporter [Patescibacteria group bacterium]MBU4390139.1 DMT family transporter [Patescibacteria group bacterium]MBU4397228.1 DMT family transporter [Patescibacteria group bacterium]
MKNRKLGILSLFSVGAMYGMYGVYSRMIGDAFGNFNQNWLRNLAVALIAGLIILISRSQLKPLLRKDIKWIIIWFLSGSWVAVLTFIAFNNLKIGTVYLVLYSAMITSGYLSGQIFFKEKTSLTKIISLALAIGGLAIIYKFSIAKEEMIYAIMCLVSGLMIGVWNTISKKFSDNYPNMQMVLMDAIASVIATLIGATLFKEILPSNINPVSWLWLLIYAFTQVANVGLIVYGFKNLEAQIGSIILPVEIVFATIFAFIFFKEYPTLSAYIGGMMIIGAAIIPSLEIIFAKKSPSPDLS